MHKWITVLEKKVMRVIHIPYDEDDIFLLVSL